MIFDTKVAIVVLDDLAVWQKLNVTAFLATGIAAEAPEALGEPYEDAAGRRHARMLGQPMLVFAAQPDGLLRAWTVALERGLLRAVYVRAMFDTGHDAANRAVFKEEPADAPDLVGIASGSKCERLALPAPPCPARASPICNSRRISSLRCPSMLILPGDMARTSIRWPGECVEVPYRRTA